MGWPPNPEPRDPTLPQANPSWEAALPEDTRSWLAAQRADPQASGLSGPYPFVPTLGTSRMPPAGINLLSHQMSWQVLQAQPLLEEVASIATRA